MLVHRFVKELAELEDFQTFCGCNISRDNNILVIGTFNPDKDSYPADSNNANWFYGRTTKNKFWNYLPSALTGISLHPAQGHHGGKLSWEAFCTQNKVVIIDMLKSIRHNKVLTSQTDTELEARISENLDNVDIFDVNRAFIKATFKLVIYSLKWTDERHLPKLIKIRDSINQKLINQGSVKGMQHIRYCKAPWRNDSLQSWKDAVSPYLPFNVKNPES